jgi:hypothetical protein
VTDKELQKIRVQCNHAGDMDYPVFSRLTVLALLAEIDRLGFLLNRWKLAFKDHAELLAEMARIEAIADSTGIKPKFLRKNTNASSRTP